MLVGLPGCGKTSFVRDVLQNVTVISTDNFIESQAALLGKTYNEVFKDTADEAKKVFNLEFDLAIKNKENIVIDQTNTTKKTRKRKLSRLPSDYKKIAIYFPCDWSTIKKRNLERKQYGRDVSDLVIFQFIEKLEAPTLDEGFDRIIIIGDNESKTVQHSL